MIYLASYGVYHISVIPKLTVLRYLSLCAFYQRRQNMATCSTVVLLVLCTVVLMYLCTYCTTVLVY